MGQSTSTPITPEMAATIKTKVNSLIGIAFPFSYLARHAEHGVVVFSKSYCPYCKKAKSLLDQRGLKARTVKFDDENIKVEAQSYIAIELDNEELGADIQTYLLELTDQRTVPNIFIAQKHIGGNDDLHALDKKGELKTLLAKI